MTEKESKKVKKRTGKLLSSFVVLTIVLSVLAVSVTSVSAEVPPPPEPTSITVTADPTSIPEDGTAESNITARAMNDSTPSSGFVLIFEIIGGPDDAELIPDPDGGAYSKTEVWDIIDENGYAYATLRAGTTAGTVEVKAYRGDVYGNTTVTLISEYGVELTVDQAERTTAPDVDALYTLTVRNTGTLRDSYTLSVDNVSSADVAELSTDSITDLGAGATADVSLTVRDADIGTYIVNVTVTGTDVSDKVTTKTNVSLNIPDLIVTEITPNCDYLFANESNNINATIKNNGTAAAGAFNVSFVVDGFREEVRIAAGLAVGANTTKCVTDPTPRNASDLVTINVTADCDGEVEELDETNNETVQAETVVNNGYKGKTYTGGENITTLQTHTLNGSVLYSVGDSYYLSASAHPNWTTYNVSWNISDLLVPANASVEKARLYVPYTWDKKGIIPGNVNMSFNGVIQILDAHYSDEKGWATSNPYGMLAYNVTADFNKTSGNVANLTNLYPGGNNVSIRGMLLVVIYADNSELQRTIIMNEGFDMLYGGSGKCTTPEEATAFAPFAGAIEDIGNKSARLITVAPGAGPNEGELIFNGHTWTDVWNFAGDTEIGIDDRYVTSYLSAENNEAAFQSSGDWMEASNAILVVEEVSPEKKYTIDLDTGYNMISMPLNDMSVTNASTLIAKIGANCTEVFKWNKTSQGWESYNQYMPPAAAFNIVGGEGYFVSMSGPETVVFTGMGWESPFSMSLVTGYNMIGIPVNDTSVTNASLLIAKIGANCTEIFKWNKTSQGWESYNQYMPPAAAFDIVCGDGYFMSMAGPADVAFEGEPCQD